MNTPKLPISIEEVNNLSDEEFTKIFGNVVKNVHSVAYLISRKHFHNIMDLYCAFCDLLDGTDIRSQVTILKLDPGLRHHLTELQDLTTENANKLYWLINEYESKFQFAFVICIEENKTENILKLISERIQNNKLMEIIKGMEEIKKSIKYRLLRIIKHEYA